MKKHGWAIGLVLVVLSGCSQTSNEEEALRMTLDDMATAAEEQDVASVASHLANDFSGKGGMSKEQTEALARVVMSRYQELSVTWTIQELEMDGDRANVKAQALLTGKSIIPGMGARGRLMTFTMGWRLSEEGTWELVNANWEGAWNG
jgi:hypothetical protein